MSTANCLGKSEIDCGISLTYIINKIGLGTDPCENFSLHDEMTFSH